MDGKHNPTDTGTRPDQVSIGRISPVSMWLKEFPWMQIAKEYAKQDGILNSVENIKLNNESKKTIKDGIV